MMASSRAGTRMTLKLIIGNKNYSSWSFRPWIAMKVAGIPCEGGVLALEARQFRGVGRETPRAGRVPALAEGEARVWESLAILEYLSGRFPDAKLWPADPKARAHARSLAAEMHAGFVPLRRECPMNFWRPVKQRELSTEAVANVKRIDAMWADCRARFGAGGEFLFGSFGAADAMYAPVVARFATYAVGGGAYLARLHGRDHEPRCLAGMESRRRAGTLGAAGGRARLAGRAQGLIRFVVCSSSRPRPRSGREPGPMATVPSILRDRWSWVPACAGTTRMRLPTEPRQKRLLRRGRKISTKSHRFRRNHGKYSRRPLSSCPGARREDGGDFCRNIHQLCGDLPCEPCLSPSWPLPRFALLPRPGRRKPRRTSRASTYSPTIRPSPSGPGRPRRSACACRTTRRRPSACRSRSTACHRDGPRRCSAADSPSPPRCPRPTAAYRC